jgi:hypothetical protein
MKAFAALLARDMRLAMRAGGGALMGALFFLIVVTLLPFAVGPDLALLRRIGPAILWLGALLASLLTLDRLFASDYEDGSLDLLVTASLPLELSIAAHHYQSAARLAAQCRINGDGTDSLDAARRDTRFDVPRIDRRGAIRDIAQGRCATRCAGSPADNSHADLWHLRG